MHRSSSSAALALTTLTAIVATGALPACSADLAERADQQSAAASTGDESGGLLSKQYFCPDALIPRKDMARYLERLKRGRNFVPPRPQNIFSDVTPNTNDAAWIEQLYADGITRGTQPGMFDPEGTVPREQMAAFIVRLFHGAGFTRGGPSRYTDVHNPDFVGYIEQLADDGITKGCTATEFCPRDMVRRDQMAAFLMRAAHPGQADPASSGRFADTPSHNVLAGRVEQAVAEGIMEPCDPTFRVPVLGAGFGFDGSRVDHPAPTIDNFLGWIHTTPNYGFYVHSRDKRYFNDWHRDSCGGDYNVTTVLDIGQVTHDGVYVRSVTFYVQGVPRVAHQEHVWLGTNGNIDKFVDHTSGVDSSGIPYRSYRIDRYFPGGQGRFGDALQVQHTMIPEGKFPNKGSLQDNPDGGLCAMILRGALASY